MIVTLFPGGVSPVWSFQTHSSAIRSGADYTVIRKLVLMQQVKDICISEQIVYITTVLNLFMEKLMLGMGRQKDMLDFLRPFSPASSSTRPPTPPLTLCEINLKKLYFQMEKARMIVPPVIPI
jgi:hypothetical protein